MHGLSDAGLFIMNYQAGSVYEVECGVRDNYDSTRAMLTNSLFSDFLKENGLHIHKGESTRDIICIKFDYGSRSYEQEKNHIARTIKDAEEQLAAETNENLRRRTEVKLERLAELAVAVEQNKDKFIKISANDLRTKFYEEGVTIHYPRESIHYQMLYRTPGKAKKGECMFVRDSLYKKARKFLYMGIKLPKENAQIVEIGAYSSLITSAIEERLRIEPEQILVIKDVDAFFTTNVLSVEIDEQKHCVAKHKENYKLKNTLFDGQALIDVSIFPSWASGYVLLRHHFCKMAAFVSRIQDYFRDTFGDEYETKTVKDMWGNDHLAKDIRLITTENAMKWSKFPGITFEYWSEWVRTNGCNFGIVKTAHQSKLGEYQRMSYQMVNALDIETIPFVMGITLSYIERLKTDDTAFLDFLRKNQNFSNDYEPLIKICEKNPNFLNCDYFRERKRKILHGYTNKVKFGKVLQNADNLVIVGSPYAMLMAAAGLDPFDDPTFKQEEGAMQCWTSRFRSGEYLAEFRSPLNSRNNLGLLHNTRSLEFDLYFPFGKQIIAINMIGTEVQDRNNGLTYWVSVQKCA